MKKAISSALKPSFVTVFPTNLDQNSPQNEIDIISTSAMLALGYVYITAPSSTSSLYQNRPIGS
jgi:hypothetical protein